MYIQRCKSNFEPNVKVLCKAKLCISVDECASTITVTNEEKAEAHWECKDERLNKWEDETEKEIECSKGEKSSYSAVDEQHM